MNVLMLVHNTSGQGTYRRAMPLARELVRKGHSVTLISTSVSQRFVLKTRTIEGVLEVESPDIFSGGLRSGWGPTKF